MFNQTIESEDNPIGMLVGFGTEPEVNDVDYLYPRFIKDTLTLIKTDLAACQIHLWKAGALTLSKDLTINDFLAAECLFSGYDITIVTTWDGPYNAAGGGSFIESGMVSVVGSVDVPFVSGVIGGYFLTKPGPILAFAGQFASPAPIAKTGDVCSFNIQLPYGIQLPAA